MAILTKPKHNDFQALSKWILPCIEGFSPVFGSFADKEIVITPNESEIVTRYLDGTAYFWKTYGVQAYFSVAEDYKVWSESDAENSENIQEFELSQSINEWINEQEKLHNYPIVDGWHTNRVEPTGVMPNFDGVDESGDVKLARYTLFVRVYYTGVM